MPLATSSLTRTDDKSSDDQDYLETYIGKSGSHYHIKEVLQDRGYPLGRVYLASSQSGMYIIKNVIPSDFGYYENMQQSLRGCQHVRQLHDTIPDLSMFVYRYFSDHLLRLVQANLSGKMTRRVLKDALRGLAELHERNIVHTDIKPDNILVERIKAEHGFSLGQVQLGDIESAAVLPPKGNIVGGQVGNMMWRSPEAYAAGPVNRPSDIFSFALVCIYAVTKHVIFAVGDEELGPGEIPEAHIMERQLSYFAEPDTYDAFAKHIGHDNPYLNVFDNLKASFGEDNPRTPFNLWKGEGLESDFIDLVWRMTSFDPDERLTATEALDHKWFHDV